VTRMIQLSCWVYRRLLVFYPRELREKFGTQMVEVFEDLLWEVTLQSGAAGIAPVWRNALWELLSIGAVARMQSTPVVAGLLSLIISSIIAWEFFRAVG
jgi:hypothetical protein